MEDAHKLAGAVGFLLLLVGIAAGIHGEVEARRLSTAREQILQGYQARIPEIEDQLKASMLSEERRSQLNRELSFCKRGITGIPGYFTGNARRCGYGLGGFCASAGVLCIVYCLIGSERRKES
jgi:hypothetical protein